MDFKLNNTKKSLIILTLLLIITGCSASLNKNKGDIPEPIFVKSYGTYRAFEGEGTISVMLFSDWDFLNSLAETSNEVYINKVNSDSFGEGVEIDSFKYSIISEKDGILLSVLNFDITDVKEKTDIISFNHNGKDYEIGKITLEPTDNKDLSDEFLEIKSNAGASMGLGLKDYHAEFINKSKDDIEITDLYDGNFDAVAYLEKNGLKKLPVVAKAGETLTLRIKFEKPEEGYEIFYASPIVLYKHKGEEKRILLFPYSSGLILSKEDIESLYDKYVENNINIYK